MTRFGPEMLENTKPKESTSRNRYRLAEQVIAELKGPGWPSDACLFSPPSRCAGDRGICHQGPRPWASRSRPKTASAGAGGQLQNPACAPSRECAIEIGRALILRGG